MASAGNHPFNKEFVSASKKKVFTWQEQDKLSICIFIWWIQKHSLHCIPHEPTHLLLCCAPKNAALPRLVSTQISIEQTRQMKVGWTSGSIKNDFTHLWNDLSTPRNSEEMKFESQSFILFLLWFEFGLVAAILAESAGRTEDGINKWSELNLKLRHYWGLGGTWVHAAVISVILDVCIHTWLTTEVKCFLEIRCMDT